MSKWAGDPGQISRRIIADVDTQLNNIGKNCTAFAASLKSLATILYYLPV